MRNSLLFYLFFLFLTIISSCSGNNADKNAIESARSVIIRQIGDRANQIEIYSLTSSTGKDTFNIEAKDGKLKIGGNSPTAICYAFHTYLRNQCNSMKTWSGQHLNIPDKWPDVELQKSSPYDKRYFLNVCTFGYTTPYWDWNRWEKEIDWMAMRGVNMPLATVASEAIAERVWLQMGLTKEETREFFTAPAHLPWHRMGNLNTWDGPLSDEWQAEQIALQHQILNRMRDLQMEPVAPAFAGFVPMAFAQKHPEINFKHLMWGGFDDKYNAYVLPPDSPYFEEIGRLFIEEWEKEFGKNTYYLSDSFNEMRLPVAEGDTDGKHNLLTQYGESIHRSIQAGNPDAVWVTQGWTFGYQHDFWDRESLQALLSKVPDDKIIIIDLGNDYPKWVWNTEQTWKNHDGFYGKNWIFSYVPNFGGKTPLTGDLQMYASSSAEALNSSEKGNLIGFGSAPEGLENNEIVYELLADMGWEDQPIDLDDWTKSYCIARYGSYPEPVKEAWDLFRNTAYSSLYSYPRFTWQTVVPDQRRISKIDVSPDFLKGVELYLSASDSLQQSQLYVNDAIELAAFYLAAKADQVYIQALQADSLGNQLKAKEYLNLTIRLLLETDQLLGSHPIYRLDEWVKMARRHGKTDEESDAYEANAKRLITTWGGFQEDYAARFWNGLIKDYYVPRLNRYFSNQRDDLDRWEETWINTPWNDTTIIYDDPLNKAKELVAQAALI